MKDILMRPIGVIHSPFTDKKKTPIQASRSDAIGTVEVFEEYSDGLEDIDGFSHLILIYAFHRSSGYKLKVKPFLDDNLHGLFSTRYPRRPNPIGLSVVYLLYRHSTASNLLQIQGVDVIDGTPLLDVKPYMPEFDERRNVRTGWYSTRSIE